MLALAFETLLVLYFVLDAGFAAFNDFVVAHTREGRP